MTIAIIMLSVILAFVLLVALMLKWSFNEVERQNDSLIEENSQLHRLLRQYSDKLSEYEKAEKKTTKRGPRKTSTETKKKETKKKEVKE